MPTLVLIARDTAGDNPMQGMQCTPRYISVRSAHPTGAINRAF